MNIQLVGEAEIAQRRFPMPKVEHMLYTHNQKCIFTHTVFLSYNIMCLCLVQAVLRIHFLEAQDLIGKDKFLGGLIKGKSDPYGVIQLGNQLFRSKVIKESVNPKWNEVYEVCVHVYTILWECICPELNKILQTFALFRIFSFVKHHTAKNDFLAIFALFFSTNV